MQNESWKNLKMSHPDKTKPGTQNRPAHIRSVADLDDESLGAICSFLPKTSIYLFAAAVSAPSSSWYKSRHLLTGSEEPQLQEGSKTIFAASHYCHLSNSLVASLAGERESFKSFFNEVVSAKSYPKMKSKTYWEESLLSQCDTGLLWSRAKLNWEHKFVDCMLDDQDLRDIFRLYCYYTEEKHVLDFIDIPCEMAAKITDEDLCAVLMMFFFFSKKKLKELYLTDCAGIIGHGLEPIKFFPSLETVDLSKGGRPLLNTLEQTVVPFLHELVSKADDHILTVKIPYEWMERRSRGDNEESDASMDASVLSFRSLLKAHKHAYNSNSQCSYFGFQGSSRSLINSLAENHQFTLVDECDRSGSCNGFSFVGCEHCGKVECESGCTSGDDIWTCQLCGTTTCYHCRNKFGVGDSIVSSCDEKRPLKEYGNHILCGSCRFKECCNVNTQRCTTCLGWSFDKLMQLADERKNQIHTLEDRINSLEEAKRLEDQNKRRKAGFDR